MPLPHERKLQIDKILDQGLPTFNQVIDQQAAVVHLLRTAERRFREIALDEPNCGIEQTFLRSDVLREAVHHALRWIYEQLQPSANSQVAILETEQHIYYEFSKVLDVAMSYSIVCDYICYAFLKDVDSHEPTANTIEFSQTKEQILHEAAQWLWRSHREPLISDPTEAIAELRDFCRQFKLEDYDEGTIFKIPNELLKKFQLHIRPNTESLWSIQESLNLGAFDMNEYRNFWISLRTIAVVQRFLFSAAAEYGVQAAIPIAEKKTWIEILSALSELDSSKIEKILDLLVYEKAFTEKVKDKHATEAMSQPLFQVDELKIALSVALVINSNAERNFYDLFAAKEQSLYDSLKQQKEIRWAQKLADRFNQLGFLAKPRLVYPGGDFDVFVMDLESKNVLIIELKWLLIDRIKNDHLKDGRKAISQVKRGKDWLSKNRKHAASLLHLSPEQFDGITVYPIAVFKDSILNGLVLDPEVPFISDKILEHCIESTSGDIAEIWHHLHVKKSFLPVEKLHFELERSSVTFNGITFVKRQIKLLPAFSQWDPFN